MSSDDLRRTQNPIAAYAIVGCFVVSVLIAWFA
jgi:hypothetical protein